MKRHLSLLLSRLGYDLLIIGAQVWTGARQRADLLAIDANGAIYIIELKLQPAKPEAIAQTLDYRGATKRLSREEIIRIVADGHLKMNLERAFKRHFGRPLPETVNASQEIMIIAPAVEPRTARSILELLDLGCSITVFCWRVSDQGVSLVRQDLEALQAAGSAKKTKPPIPFVHIREPRIELPSNYQPHIDEEVRRFWQDLDRNYDFPLISFHVISVDWMHWRRTHAREGIKPPPSNDGVLAQQIIALVAESEKWARVFILPGSDMDADGTLLNPSTAQTERDFEHRVVAYRRNPGDRHPTIDTDFAPRGMG